MSTENQKTIEIYEQYADVYERNTLEDFKENPQKAKAMMDNYREFLKESLTGVPKTAKMFEVGSGYGRDVKFINSFGYNMTPSDVADSFIERLKQEQLSPVKFNLISDEFPDSFDYVLANAVLVHFTKPEVISALEKVFDALNPGGTFTFTLKQRSGGGEDWKKDVAGQKRYFSYWDNGEIEQVLKEKGFSIKTIKQIGGIKACWLDIIVQKPGENNE